MADAWVNFIEGVKLVVDQNSCLGCILVVVGYQFHGYKITKLTGHSLICLSGIFFILPH